MNCQLALLRLEKIVIENLCWGAKAINTDATLMDNVVNAPMDNEGKVRPWVMKVM